MFHEPCLHLRVPPSAPYFVIDVIVVAFHECDELLAPLCRGVFENTAVDEPLVDVGVGPSVPDGPCRGDVCIPHLSEKLLPGSGRWRDDAVLFEVSADPVVVPAEMMLG